MFSGNPQDGPSSNNSSAMSTGNPQGGHSSSSSSASGVPALVSSSSSDGVPAYMLSSSSSDSGHNIIENSPNGFSRSHGRSRSSRENWLNDTTSSDEGDDEDTRTEAAARQLHETQRAAHAAPQASLTKCHRLCAHMHAPRRAGGPWIQCTNQCREKENHNCRHNCYGDQWHKGSQLFPPRRKVCQEKENASLTKCQRFCAHMHPPCIEGGPWIQCKNQCRDKHDHNGRHNCYGDCHYSHFKVQVRVM